MLNAVIAYIRDRASNAAFQDGFWGDRFRRFKALGVPTVRHLFETRQFSRGEMDAAPRWLAIHDAKIARRKTALFWSTLAALVIAALKL